MGCSSICGASRSANPPASWAVLLSGEMWTASTQAGGSGDDKFHGVGVERERPRSQSVCQSFSSPARRPSAACQLPDCRRAGPPAKRPVVVPTRPAARAPGHARDGLSTDLNRLPARRDSSPPASGPLARPSVGLLAGQPAGCPPASPDFPPRRVAIRLQLKVPGGRECASERGTSGSRRSGRAASHTKWEVAPAATSGQEHREPSDRNGSHFPRRRSLLGHTRATKRS